MKIVISTDIYYPMINGVAVFSRNLAAGLKKRGHKVMVLAPSTDGQFKIENDPEYGFSIGLKALVDDVADACFALGTAG